MNHYLNYFPSPYLRAADLEDLGDVAVTIAGLQVEDVTNNDGKTERLPVLYFKGAHKGLILNRTNGDTIAGLHSPDVDAWAGQRIALFIERGVKAFGGVHDVIRIRSRVPERNGGQDALNAAAQDGPTAEAPDPVPDPVPEEGATS